MVKRGALHVALALLTACSAASHGPVAEVGHDAAPAPDAPGVPDVVVDAGADARDADLKPVLGGDSGAADAPDESSQPPPDADPPPDAAACIQAACSAAGAQCGTIAATCLGQPVDCGGCPAQQVCGDNGHANRCGDTCLSIYGSYCSSAGQPGAWGVSSGCTVDPYAFDQNTNALVMRPDGVQGCVYKQVPPFFLECCP